jgi:NADPH-dependent glutamate synthase beta subunit-like oxidoreductase
MPDPESYAIAIIGGATAGAEAAGIFADQGILTVVFEQNARPYGKIEDGLPRWHVALRRKEYRTIDDKLTREHVHFVPNTLLGRDIDFADLVENWGFHSVVLANGAWRDRPLPVEGADAYVGRGLVYQNAFIYWFNHYCEKDYDGPQFEILDGTIVVGGGLASIDVVKVIQLELTLRALRERGIEADLVEMEVKGIPATLAAHDLVWEDLGLEGCTLYYRRRPQDMPLVEIPENANDKTREKIMKSRQRVLEKAMDKYLFKLEPLCAPKALITEGDRLVGLTFARTRMEDGVLITTDETLDVRAPMIISSIGSIPQPLAGIAMNGELYEFDDWDLGLMKDYPTLFSVGNVVTGKGNIVASRKHARRVGQYMVSEYFKLAEDVQKLDPLTPEQREALLERVRTRQAEVGYAGDYSAWIASVTPPDLV